MPTTAIVPKIGFISLGCPKATVDSERILTQLRAEGYFISSSYEESDLVIVNTCGFIEDAVEESLEVIGEALSKNGRVIVTGCLGMREHMIRKTFPKVLAITGPDALKELMTLVRNHLPPQHDPHFDLVPPGGIKLTPRHYAYLKISEGCNQKCSFCIIPTMRGKLVSRPLDDILEEAECLVNVGVKELLIVSQDTAAYGTDVKYRQGFWHGRPLRNHIVDLARTLGTLGIWVRLHYLYPYPHVDDLVELMADGHILPYLDVPLQHYTPRLLRAMHRPSNSENMLQRITHWREICPALTLRSSFIVGFPGETDEEFEELLDFLQEVQFDRVGAFIYSPIEGAPANDLPHPIPKALQEERLEQIMTLQSQISTIKLQKRVGETITVLIDEVMPDTVYARSVAESPEIDGVIVIRPEKNKKLRSGDFVQVTIIDSDEHDLYAKLVV